MTEPGTLGDASRLLKWTIEEETGIHLRDLEVEVEEGKAVAMLKARIIARAEVEEWQLADPAALAEALHLSLGSKLKERLVELERARLEEELVPIVERRVRSALSEADGGVPEELDFGAVVLPYPYRHGDPEEAQERGYPPFGIRVRGHDPDADLTVELDREPPDPERLRRRIVQRLLEGGDRDG